MKKRVILAVLSIACISTSCTTTSTYELPEVSYDPTTAFRLPEPEPFDFSKGVHSWRTEPQQRYGVPNCDGIRDYPMTRRMYEADRMHDPLLGRPSRPGDSLLGSSKPGDSLLH